MTRIEPVAWRGEVCSSSRVRAAVAAGDVALASDLLGHPFLVEGRVVAGDRRGRELGYPTANLRPARRGLWPADGIYAVRASWQGGDGAAGTTPWRASACVRRSTAGTGASRSTCSIRRSISTVAACAAPSSRGCVPKPLCERRGAQGADRRRLRGRPRGARDGVVSGREPPCRSRPEPRILDTRMPDSYPLRAWTCGSHRGELPARPSSGAGSRSILASCVREPSGDLFD